MIKYFLAISLTFTSVSFSYAVRPESTMTPGERCIPQNPDFESYRYPEQIAYCVRNVSDRMKKIIYDNYGVPEQCRHRYTIDHFVPLSLGGTNSAKNLWPEHKALKATRPNLEYELYTALARGQISQQNAIITIINAKMNPDVPFELDCD